MKKTLIIIIVLVVVGVGAYYLTVHNKSSNGIPVYTSTVSNTPKATVSSSVIVDIKNFSFSPLTINIKTGTKVMWVNNDSVSHTVTSDSGNFLNSPTLAPGQSFSFTFTDTSSTNYHCSIHPLMRGSIVVTK